MPEYYSRPVNGTPKKVKASKHPPCPHLGPQLKRKSDNAPLTVEVTCDTCGGKRKQVAQPLHVCALFRRCLPTYRPSAEQRAEYEARPDAVRLCDGCPRQLS